MKNNYDKFRDMLPPAAGILDLSKAVNDLDAVEEIFEALEPGGLLYAKFKADTQIGEYINEDAGFDVIEVLDDGVICKRRDTGSINIFNMMC